MEFTEKYTKKYVKGSTVVEMSYLIPFCLILFFLLITIIFYFHDKAILNAAAAETAVTGVEMDRKKIENNYLYSDCLGYRKKNVVLTG